MMDVAMLINAKNDKIQSTMQHNQSDMLDSIGRLHDGQTQLEEDLSNVRTDMNEVRAATTEAAKMAQ